MRTYLVYILGLAGLVILTGTLGFHSFELGTNPNVDGLDDSLWWALVTITTIGYGDIYPVTTGGRVFAFFLMFVGIGTLSLSTAAIAAYLVRFNQLSILRLWTMRDHVVICGLGNLGFLLAQAFLKDGQQVLVVEKDEASVRVPACRDAGALVLFGDAASRETQARARVERARQLVVVCGADSNNVEVAARARELVSGRRSKLSCSTQIDDPDLWFLLRSWELGASDSFRLQFFNVADLGARAMLARHPPFESAGGGRTPHLLVVGSGRLSEHLILHAIRQWRDRPPAGADAGRLRVTLVHEEADSVHERLRQQGPDLDTDVDLIADPTDLQSPAFQRAAFLFDEQGRCEVSHAYVCVEDEVRALAAALLLHHHLRAFAVPVVVRMNQASGLAGVLDAVGRRPGFEHLHVFDLLEHACQPDLVRRGTNEILARALHEEYVARQRGGGSAAGDNPAVVAWEGLPVDIKESNRAQADHIAVKLEAVGCYIGPLIGLQRDAFAFTSDEVERLAAMEHQRWLDERFALGWTHGPRDPARKSNPNLTTWDRLDQGVKEMNRYMVREIPAFLRRAGFTVYRYRT